MEPTITLLDLINAISDQAKTEKEVVDTIVHLVNSRTVRLGGIFRGALIDVGDSEVDIERSAA